MVRRRIAVVAGLAALLASLVTGVAQAEHCRPIIMFSGVTAGGQAGPKVNPGVGGCPLVNYEDENLNTNYFAPGANSMSIGVTADPAAGVNTDGTRKTGVVQTGSVTITYADLTGGNVERTEPLSLTWSGTRWNSQSFNLPGTLVAATAEVLTQPGVTVSVTYRSIGTDA